MPYIDRVSFEGREVAIAPYRRQLSEENTFSIIIGKNGIGKSRILAQIAKMLMETKEAYGFSFGDGDFTHRVIAASTSPFDKFPYSRPRRNISTNYRYVGMRGENLYGVSSAISLISSAAKGLLEAITKDRLNPLGEIFESLGFHPLVEFIFKPSYIKSGIRGNHYVEKVPLSEAVSQEIAYLESRFGIELEQRYIQMLTEIPIFQREQLLWAIHEVSKSSIEFKALSFTINLQYGTISFEGPGADKNTLRAIHLLLSAGYMRLMDIRLDKAYQGPLSLRKASSGEQCIIALMLGIAGHIRDDSVILIDEPEISLHPRWQENFINLLMKTFRDYKRCHFIIATHSPQVIARLKGKNCFVASLQNNELYPAHFFQDRSADFQLAELFDAPGIRNEYISRLAFNLLAKVKAHKKLTDEYEAELAHLTAFRKLIDNDDPLINLIDSVEQACNFYANNQE